MFKFWYTFLKMYVKSNGSPSLATTVHSVITQTKCTEFAVDLCGSLSLSPLGVIPDKEMPRVIETMWLSGAESCIDVDRKLHPTLYPTIFCFTISDGSNTFNATHQTHNLVWQCSTSPHSQSVDSNTVDTADAHVWAQDIHSSHNVVFSKVKRIVKG